MQSPAVIQKEVLAYCRFAKDDVLTSLADKQIRNDQLAHAVRLGNGYKTKVKILFLTWDGKEQIVETTVWAVSPEFVTLKSGAFIPVRAIKSVQI